MSYHQPRPMSVRTVQLNPLDCSLNFEMRDGNMVGSTKFAGAFAYMWAGARATVGLKRGKFYFKVRILEVLDTSAAPHLGEGLDCRPMCRLGVSTAQADVSLLGDAQGSWAYSCDGHSLAEGRVQPYGRKGASAHQVSPVRDDEITCFVDLSTTQGKVGFAINGRLQGIAHELPLLRGQAVFPHLLLRNVVVAIDFEGSPALGGRGGRSVARGGGGGSWIGHHPWEACLREAAAHVVSPHSPPPFSECEVLAMVGLPGCGKTSWVRSYMQQNPGRRYVCLGLSSVLQQMRVDARMLKQLRRSGAWDALEDAGHEAVGRMTDRAALLPRNYIIDHTNILSSTRHAMASKFASHGFRCVAVVLVLRDALLAERQRAQFLEEGKTVVEHTIAEMKANFTLPQLGEFADVLYVESIPPEADAIVEHQRQAGHAFLATASASRKRPAAANYPSGGDPSDGFLPATQRMRPDFAQPGMPMASARLPPPQQQQQAYLGMAPPMHAPMQAPMALGPRPMVREVPPANGSGGGGGPAPRPMVRQAPRMGGGGAVGDAMQVAGTPPPPPGDPDGGPLGSTAWPIQATSTGLPYQQQQQQGMRRPPPMSASPRACGGGAKPSRPPPPPPPGGLSRPRPGVPPPPLSEMPPWQAGKQQVKQGAMHSPPQVGGVDAGMGGMSSLAAAPWNNAGPGTVAAAAPRPMHHHQQQQQQQQVSQVAMSNAPKVSAGQSPGYGSAGGAAYSAAASQYGMQASMAPGGTAAAGPPTHAYQPQGMTSSSMPGEPPLAAGGLGSERTSHLQHQPPQQQHQPQAAVEQQYGQQYAAPAQPQQQQQLQQQYVPPQDGGSIAYAPGSTAAATAAAAAAAAASAAVAAGPASGGGGYYTQQAGLPPYQQPSAHQQAAHPQQQQQQQGQYDLYNSQVGAASSAYGAQQPYGAASAYQGEGAYAAAAAPLGSAVGQQGSAESAAAAGGASGAAAPTGQQQQYEQQYEQQQNSQQQYGQPQYGQQQYDQQQQYGQQQYDAYYQGAAPPQSGAAPPQSGSASAAAAGAGMAADDQHQEQYRRDHVHSQAAAAAAVPWGPQYSQAAHTQGQQEYGLQSPKPQQVQGAYEHAGGPEPAAAAAAYYQDASGAKSGAPAFFQDASGTKAGAPAYYQNVSGANAGAPAYTQDASGAKAAAPTYQHQQQQASGTDAAYAAAAQYAHKAATAHYSGAAHYSAAPAARAGGDYTAAGEAPAAKAGGVYTPGDEARSNAAHYSAAPVARAGGGYSAAGEARSGAAHYSAAPAARAGGVYIAAGEAPAARAGGDYTAAGEARSGAVSATPAARAGGGYIAAGEAPAAMAGGGYTAAGEAPLAPGASSQQQVQQQQYAQHQQQYAQHQQQYAQHQQQYAQHQQQYGQQQQQDTFGQQDTYGQQGVAGGARAPPGVQHGSGGAAGPYTQPPLPMAGAGTTPPQAGAYYANAAPPGAAAPGAYSAPYGAAPPPAAQHQQYAPGAAPPGAASHYYYG